MSTNQLQIGTCAWRKKHQEKEGRRDFIFGARDINERDEWITTIEYLRAKAVYDGFVTKYCNVSFLSKVKNKKEEIVGDQRDDKFNNSVDFGLKLKSQSRTNSKIEDINNSSPTTKFLARRDSLKPGALL